MNDKTKSIWRPKQDTRSILVTGYDYDELDFKVFLYIFDIKISFYFIYLSYSVKEPYWYWN